MNTTVLHCPEHSNVKCITEIAPLALNLGGSDFGVFATMPPDTEITIPPPESGPVPGPPPDPIRPGGGAATQTELLV